MAEELQFEEGAVVPITIFEDEGDAWFTLKFFEDINLVFKDHFDFRFFEALQFESNGFIVLFVFGFDYFAEAALAEEFLDFVVGLEVGVLAQGGQGICGSLLFHLDYIIMEDYLVIFFYCWGTGVGYWKEGGKS